MYDAVIIGGGITGCFIARRLCRFALDIVVIEKKSDVSDATTKANSGIVHSGYDAYPGSKKSELNRRGNTMFDRVCAELDVGFKRIGSLTVATDDDELATLEKLMERGRVNDIPGLSLLSASEVRRLEPHIHADVKGALYAETAGIVDPFEMAIALAENAVDNGAELMLETEVVAIEQKGDGYKLTTNNGAVEARYVINCAGVHAEEVNAMLAPPRFKITARRGEYIVFDKKAGSLVQHVIFQCPSEKGKGVLVTPTVHGNLLVGPNAEAIEDKDDLSTTPSGLKEICQAALRSVDAIPMNMAITNFSGLRATSDVGDFIIEELQSHKGFINVAGIESPGLTASPAIAEEVVEILRKSGLKLEPKASFNPERRPVVRFMELDDARKNQLIQENPCYGRIICRCENITEAEIVDAIRRNVGARSIDGVKKRIRAGMGRCQGGFCSPRIIEILARELKADFSDVSKSGNASYILTGKL